MKITKQLFLASILMLSFCTIDAQLEWVKYDGSMPDGAVVGGVETNRSLVVCRCDYRGAMHPGKVVEKACNIGWGGKERIVKDFEVLVNKGIVELSWLKSDGELPDNAIQAGTERGGPLYVGRTFHKNGTHPGKIFKAGGNYICNIGWGGKESTHKSFEVLVQIPHDEYNEKMKHTKECSKKFDNSKNVIASLIGTMGKERQISEGYSLVSSNLKFQTRVTDDGRLVIEEILDRALCDDGRIIVLKTNEIWANTNKKGDASLDYYLKFQNDSNLCIYSEQNGFVWCSMSNGRNGHHFEITNVGHIEVVNDHGGEVWPD